MADYLHSGLTGSFANLAAKNAFEIPMSVFLPSGCSHVRQTISGTDLDGLREVEGKIAIYESKNQSAQFSEGQKRALLCLLKRGGVDFVVLSRWEFHDLVDEPSYPESQRWLSYGYSKFAIPRKAAIFCSVDNHEWLSDYLFWNVTYTFLPQVNTCQDNILRFVVEFPSYDPSDYVMKPTPEWLALAWLPDSYAKSCQ